MDGLPSITQIKKAMKEHSEPSKEETKKDNELIAEFMGYYINRESHNAPVIYYPDGDYSYMSDAGFELCWDRIMPVVEEIEELEEPISANPMRGTFWPYEIIRRKKSVEVYNDGQILFGVGGSDVKAVNKAVVQFIKWYNSQQYERK